MHIALVIERFNPKGGGAERSTAQIATELRKAGHQVTILAAAAPPEEYTEGFTVRTMGMHGRFGAIKLYRFSKWARKQLQDGGFDVSLSVTTTIPAHVVQPRSGTLKETFARNIAMRTNPLSRAFKRVMLLLSPKHQLLLALERRTMRDRLVKRFAAVSAYGRHQLIDGYQVDSNRITVLPNAAAMPVVTLADRQKWREQIRQGFSVPADALVYVFAALNARLKGAHTLIDAAAILRQRGLENFVILMAGPVGYRQQHHAASAGVRDSIRFIGATSHMDQLYCAADVTVLPTFYDPSSKVVIESLMMGVPAISTKYNGASDMILPGNGVTRGRVIDDPADAKALADAMQQLADPAARAHAAAASQGLADELSMATHVRQLITILQDAARQ